MNLTRKNKRNKKEIITLIVGKPNASWTRWQCFGDWASHYVLEHHPKIKDGSEITGICPEHGKIF